MGAGSKRQRFNKAISKGVPVIINQPQNCGHAQQTVIAVLVGSLYTNVSHEINYDHVNLALPRKPVPLEYRKHRYDIACLVGGRVFLIDVLNVDANYWQRSQELTDGEGEV
jgi:hypothetical protein